jgi:hypothetical protein
LATALAAGYVLFSSVSDCNTQCIGVFGTRLVADPI